MQPNPRRLDCPAFLLTAEEGELTASHRKGGGDRDVLLRNAGMLANDQKNFQSAKSKRKKLK